MRGNTNRLQSVFLLPQRLPRDRGARDSAQKHRLPPFPLRNTLVVLPERASTHLMQFDLLPPTYTSALRSFSNLTSVDDALSISGGEPPLKLVTLGEPLAKCLDGSAAGYYYRPGATDNFAIYLQGGGLCVEPLDCLERARNSLGSSTNWPSSRVDNRNVLSSAAFNPFRSYHHVYVPYCSGDMYIGRQRKRNAFGLRFAGHHILEAVLSDLLNRTTLATATRVLLSGGSAGGYGAFVHADWFHARLATAGARATIGVAPQSGAFFVANDVALIADYLASPTQPTPLNFSAVASAYLYEFFGGLDAEPQLRPFLDESCAEAHASHVWECWSVAKMFEHVSARVFVAQNRFDSCQAGQVLLADYWPLPLGRAAHAASRRAFLRYFGRQTLDGIVSMASRRNGSVAEGPPGSVEAGGLEAAGGVAGALEAGGVASPAADGLFVPSCYSHTGNMCMKGGTRIGGVSLAESLHDWLVGGSTVPHQLVDTCAGQDPCNPACEC